MNIILERVKSFSKNIIFFTIFVMKLVRINRILAKFGNFLTIKLKKKKEE